MTHFVSDQYALYCFNSSAASFFCTCKTDLIVKYYDLRKLKQIELEWASKSQSLCSSKSDWGRTDYRISTALGKLCKILGGGL